MAQPASVPRETPTPVVRIVSMEASASVGGGFELDKIAKSFPDAGYNPKVNPNFLNLRLKDGSGIGILRSGKMVYPKAGSEGEARQAIEEAVLELRQRNIPVPSDPVVGVDSANVFVYFGRGIEIQSLPEHLADSIYVRKTGDFLQATYNKSGVVLQLTSKQEVERAVNEVTGGRGGIGVAHVSADGTSRATPYTAYCKLRDPIVAEMIRGEDKDGKMLLTGTVRLIGTKSEGEAQDLAGMFGKMLEQAGLFGPLTPLDRIPNEGRDAQASYDYFANELKVAATSKVRGFANGFIPVPAPSANNPFCYNCFRFPFVHDGIRWVPAEWIQPFKGNTAHSVNIGAPPQRIWVCPECSRCVVCGERGIQGLILRAQSLTLKNHIPTVVFYCKAHEYLAAEARGVAPNKVPKQLAEPWSRYLIYQREKLSVLDTPQAKERVHLVKDLIDEYR